MLDFRGKLVRCLLTFLTSKQEIPGLNVSVKGYYTDFCDFPFICAHKSVEYLPELWLQILNLHTFTFIFLAGRQLSL